MFNESDRAAVIFKIKFYSLIVAFCFWENELIFRMSDCYFERGIRQVLSFIKVVSILRCCFTFIVNIEENPAGYKI